MSKSQFDMMKVNLWAAGSVDDNKNGGWCAHLHCVVNQQHYTKAIGGYAQDTTPTRMGLQAILNGLLQLKKNKPVFVHIYTSAVQISAGLNKNMYNWQKNNWLISSGNKHPEHVDLWKQIYAILTDSNRVMSYRVHLQNQEMGDQPYRLVAITESANYLLKGKKNLYEVSLT